MDQWTNRLAPHLRALVALSAHDGHMTQAAEALGVPQSSMSRRVHALEKELGIPLLIHDGRIVRLTAAAQRLAKQMREPLRELDSVIGEVTGEADPDQGTVRFGFPLTMGSGRIPDLLAEFRHHHPGIKVLLKQAHGSALTAELLAGDLDLAVVIPAPERLRHVRIGTQRIQVAVPSNHPLAALEQVELADLKHETFIANPPSYNLRQLTETWCREAGYTPDIAFEVTEFATIRELVSRGLGIALLPNDKRIPPSMIELPLVGSQYRRDITLVWSATTEAPATRRLSSFLLHQPG
ncbi:MULTISPECIES: LysR family transcriptional regulator [Dietzia]|jgi:DNA-binding transcriptional LysR family regulator|uniref:LysR family transcriptional regulator n=1 Tax=Dietzia TaxID=37914 RepID=UPI0013D484B3|nr:MULTISPECIES: LysR family transcriptional regulator [Dietzia]MCT1435553.1 LysR family transcriptional regulator [Dietzia maris]MCT1522078.1 LysR family transcriptional regulator [Dietzia maris]